MNSVRELHFGTDEILGTPAARQAAAAAGWIVDKDDWWTRRLRVGDPPICDVNSNSHIGFTAGGAVYAVSAERALEYDRLGGSGA